MEFQEDSKQCKHTPKAFEGCTVYTGTPSGVHIHPKDIHKRPGLLILEAGTTQVKSHNSLTKQWKIFWMKTLTKVFIHSVAEH